MMKFLNLNYCRTFLCAVMLFLYIPILNANDRLTGKSFVVTHCAGCHQTGLIGTSPNKNASPFWDLGKRIPINTISESLLRQFSLRHSEMPKFKLSSEQARSIMLWIEWVQPKAHGSRLVQHYCLPCHAIGLDDESQHPEATPFRDVSIFTSMKSLREKFKNGIETNHPDMPTFGVDDVVLERILTHIEALQNRN